MMMTMMMLMMTRSHTAPEVSPAACSSTWIPKGDVRGLLWAFARITSGLDEQQEEEATVEEAAVEEAAAQAAAQATVEEEVVAPAPGSRQMLMTRSSTRSDSALSAAVGILAGARIGED